MEPSRTATAVRASDRRRHVRVPALYHLVLQAGDRIRIVSIEDISLDGASVFAADPPAPGVPVFLAFPKSRAKASELLGISGRIVRRAGGGVVGIMFDPGQEQAVQSVFKLPPALRTARQKAATTAARRRTAVRRSAVKTHVPKTKRAAKRR